MGEGVCDCVGDTIVKDLIEALTIFFKYSNEYAPTHCEHDVLCVVSVPKELPDADLKRLEELSFFWSEEHDCWASFRFGSA